MKEYVYVVTNEDTHNIIGVYDDPVRAFNAMWSLTIGKTIDEIEEQLVGTRYTVFNEAFNEHEVYYIEKMVLNEKFR